MEKRLRFDMELPKDIRLIQETFKKHGFKLYVVGGAVRDAYMGLRPKDYDLATDALPDKVEGILKELHIRSIATGKAFGVINAITNDDEYEIATFREDIGSGRRPEGIVFTTIEGDVKRRDLTINALFYDIEEGFIIDLIGGLDDIDNKIVRTVGLAEDRFGEDRLRILRAVRFAGRFGSELDQDIQQALERDSSLEGISAERIRDEFIKGIKSAKSLRHFLRMIKQYDLFAWIFPELSVSGRFFECSNPIIAITMLLGQLNKPELMPKVLNRLTYSKDEIKAIMFLNSLCFMDATNVVSVKRQQKNSGLKDAQIREFARLAGLSGIMVDAMLDFKLTVSGSQLMEERGISAGPMVGILVDQIERNNFAKMLF